MPALLVSPSCVLSSPFSRSVGFARRSCSSEVRPWMSDADVDNLSLACLCFTAPAAQLSNGEKEKAFRSRFLLAKTNPDASDDRRSSGVCLRPRMDCRCSLESLRLCSVPRPIASVQTVSSSFPPLPGIIVALGIFVSPVRAFSPSTCTGPAFALGLASASPLLSAARLTSQIDLQVQTRRTARLSSRRTRGARKSPLFWSKRAIRLHGSNRGRGQEARSAAVTV